MDSVPVQKVKAALKRAQAKQDRERSLELVQLPLWPEPRRGMPNNLARCALFTARGSQGKGAKRQHFNAKSILTTENGVHVTYTGQELRQDDLDVFLQLSHVGQGCDLNNPFPVTGYAVLRELGWGKGGDKYDRLKECVVRLMGGVVVVAKFLDEDPQQVDETRGFAGQLIKDLDWYADEWMVRLDPRLVKLFGPKEYTWLKWEQRKKLNPLAKWLHSYYSSHSDWSKQRPAVASIREWSGSETTGELKYFRSKLKGAIKELKTHGIASSVDIDKNDRLVLVEA